MKEEETETTRHERHKKWDRNENPATDYKESDLQMGDVFDVTKEVLIVHSPITTMNPDFIMSDLDPTLLNNPLINFVREQLKITEIINIHLNNERTKDIAYRTLTNQLILNEVYSIVILSRPKDGRVIKAILEYIKGNTAGIPTTTPIEEPEEKRGIAQRMNPLNLFKKKKTEENK